MKAVHWVRRKVCGSMERQLWDEQVKELEQPWLLKRTGLLQWRRMSSIKTVQKATPHHHWNICLEHQRFQTAARFKCVHSHPIHAWDPWLWNKSPLYGIDKGAKLMKFKADCDFGEKVSVFDNGKPGHWLSWLWYNSLFAKKVATSILMYSHRADHLPQLQNISLCVYYEVQQWKRTVYDRLPQECGWKESDEMFSLSKLTYHQLYRTSCRLSDAVAIQIVAVWCAHAK